MKKTGLDHIPTDCKLENLYLQMVISLYSPIDSFLAIVYKRPGSLIFSKPIFSWVESSEHPSTYWLCKPQEFTTKKRSHTELKKCCCVSLENTGELEEKMCMVLSNSSEKHIKWLKSDWKEITIVLGELYNSLS